MLKVGLRHFVFNVHTLIFCSTSSAYTNAVFQNGNVSTNISIVFEYGRAIVGGPKKYLLYGRAINTLQNLLSS